MCCAMVGVLTTLAPSLPVVILGLTLGFQAAWGADSGLAISVGAAPAPVGAGVAGSSSDKKLLLHTVELEIGGNGHRSCAP